MSLSEPIIVSADQVQTDYNVSADVRFPFPEFADEQEQRVYRGGLRVEGDLESAEGVDWNPFNMVVDGDLVVNGTIDWGDYGPGCYILVTGNVRCRNLFLQGCPTFVVRGDLVVDNGIQGYRGDDGGVLIVRGKTRATLIVNTLYFNMEFGSVPDALVVSDDGRINCPVDFDEGELGDLFLPELFYESRIDERLVSIALHEGRDVLRPGIRPSYRIALEMIEAMIAKGHPVAELDLSRRKLREFPARLVELRGLKRLVLRDNPLGELSEAIGAMTELEELDVSKCRLQRLPDALASLTKLTTLNLSENPFEVLPDVVGRLPALRVLRASSLRGTNLDALEGAAGLEELDLSYLRPKGRSLIDFPPVVLRLPRLRSLNLYSAALAGVPDELAELTELETLDLSGAVGQLTRLPPLHRLPRLRTLLISGRVTNTGASPHALLDGIWSITTLEHLAIDHYREEHKRRVVVRPALESLPDEAFARMPGLRVLDLSSNELTHLPESFYALRHLESVDLRYTKLDRATLDRLGTAFPHVRLDLRDVKTRSDVDDPNWRAVHEAVESAAQEAGDDKAAAVAGFESALALCTPGSSYSDYDELYALYGIVDALGHLRLPTTGAERDALAEKIIHHATLALDRVPNSGTIWHFTDEGAFQEEVTRRTGNALACLLMERGELERALAVADRALSVGGENKYVLDTKVRILLGAGRDHEAYLIVDRVLTQDPSFGDFQDLAVSPAFQSWRAANR